MLLPSAIATTVTSWSSLMPAISDIWAHMRAFKQRSGRVGNWLQGMGCCWQSVAGSWGQHMMPLQPHLESCELADIAQRCYGTTT
jgi:hypothetical protein